MIRTQVYLTDEQARDIKLLATREKKREAVVIRELVDTGLHASQSMHRESTGEALLRLAEAGERVGGNAPSDLSSRIDDYLYGEE